MSGRPDPRGRGIHVDQMPSGQEVLVAVDSAGQAVGCVYVTEGVDRPWLRAHLHCILEHVDQGPALQLMD